MLSGKAVNLLSVRMAPGTKILMAPAEGDNLLREKGVVNLAAVPFGVHEGENLKLELHYGEKRRGDFEVPLLTVTAAAAETLRGNIELDAKRPRNYLVELDEKDVDEGVCFVAKFTDLNGTILYLR